MYSKSISKSSKYKKGLSSIMPPKKLDLCKDLKIYKPSTDINTLLEYVYPIFKKSLALRSLQYRRQLKEGLRRASVPFQYIIFDNKPHDKTFANHLICCGETFNIQILKFQGSKSDFYQVDLEGKIMLFCCQRALSVGFLKGLLYKYILYSGKKGISTFSFFSYTHKFDFMIPFFEQYGLYHVPFSPKTTYQSNIVRIGHDAAITIKTILRG